MNEEILDDDMFSFFDNNNKLFKENENEKYNNDNNVDDDLEEGNDLPHLLLKNIENKDNINIRDESSVNELNINCKPYIPKKRLSSINMYYNYFYIINANKTINKNLNNYIINNNSVYNKNFNAKERKNKNKKNKKTFIERDGDWQCYRCKNINFSFRDKCNKCQLLKEDSEKEYIEAGKKLLKLINNNSIDRKIRG